MPRASSRTAGSLSRTGAPSDHVHGASGSAAVAHANGNCHRVAGVNGEREKKEEDVDEWGPLISKRG